jgi:chromosome segregation ATPase
MGTKQLTIQLDEARQTLQRLQEDLPRYHGLMTDSQANEASLQKDFREGTGKFSDLTDAKTATMTAKELLDQHRSDIANAQAEVNGLERQLDREQKEREWQALLAEREAIESEWDDGVTQLTRQYLEGLKTLEPLLERRRDYFQKVPMAGQAVGLANPVETNRHLFNFYLSSLRDLEEFTPHFYGGGNCTLEVRGQHNQKLFTVVVQNG